MDGMASPPPESAFRGARGAALGGAASADGGGGAGATTVGNGNGGGLSGTGVRVGVGGTGVAVGAGAGDEQASESATAAKTNNAAAGVPAFNAPRDNPLRRRFGNVHRFDSDTRKPHPH